MPNINNIERLLGGNTPAQGVNAIPSYVPTTTSATVLTNQAGSAAALSVSTTQYLTGAATAPSFGVAYDGFTFKLRLTGKVTTGAACNVTVAIMQGNTTTYTAGNVIATTSATAINTASNNFTLEAVCLWDGVSTKLNGYQTGQIANTLVSLAAITTQTIALQSSLQFVPVLTVSATTGVTVSITEFTAETI